MAFPAKMAAPAEMDVSPAQTYRERLAAHEEQFAALERRHARIGAARLALAAAFLVLLWACFGPLKLPPVWLLAPGAGFIAALIRHARVRRLWARSRAGMLLYRQGLDRIGDRWDGHGPGGGAFADADHVYAADLDLFGPGNLFQLLCAARTQMGEACLARWLLAPAAVEVIHDRHQSIEDLRARVDLREDWATLGDAEAVAVHPERLITWAQSANTLDKAWIRAAALVLPLLAIVTAVAWAVWDLAFPFVAVVIAEIGAWYGLRQPIHRAIAAIESAYEDLKNLRLLLERIESETFESPRLRALAAALASGTRSASATMSRLATIVNWVESRRNPFLAPFMLLLLYPLQAALAAERWRRAHGRTIGAWLDVLGEIEALLSLARYSFEHPEDPFPQFASGPACFRAAGLGHPLIASAVRVCNDLDISGEVRLLLVSGSNMSGKSTLLRTVGVNAVLAMAGAPVCARSLRLTPLQVGASIRINDSLHEGSSRFYAEITRLRRLLEPGPLPMLFLLDELLQGTNSADRRVGAQGVARGFIARGHIGLISTHDLALADIPGLPQGALLNVHFQDELREGRLSFDYRLRAGVVTKSNGVELMRSIGLDV